LILPQIITDAKRQGWYDWIAEPDGSLHPNTERALIDGYVFDAAAAQKVQDFCVQFFTLPREAGERITDYELESIRRRYPDFDPDKPCGTKPFAMLKWWHRRVVGQLYGWRRPNGARRFRKAFVTTAKKSGKTTTLSVLPLIEIMIGDTPEKEAYVIATTEDQAGYLYKKTHATLKRSPLSDKVRSLYSTLKMVYEPTASSFTALPADANTVQGINPSLLIMDELHAWRGRELYDALIYGDIKREDSLKVVITTAGDDDKSVCYEEYELAKDILDPNSATYLPDTFAFVAEAGKDPISGKYSDWAWDDERSLVQANPTLLENSAPLTKMRQELETVKASPSKKRNWIRYMCNRWVASVGDAWIGQDRWRKCAGHIAGHEGDAAWCALDLAKVEDMVAIALAWWNEDGRTADLKVKFWMPEEGIAEKAERWRVPQLHQWIEEGWIQTTPGYAIDSAFLRQAISGVMCDEMGTPMKARDRRSIAAMYDVQELAFDRWRASDLVVHQIGEVDGVPVVEHGQGYQSMSAPAKELEKRIANGTIRHDGNPVLDWQFSHAVVDVDPAENIKPNKQKSRHKIDGVVAAVMAVGRITASRPKAKSVYGRRGVIVI
jgi:phage terminase large subunit-like protein